MNEIRKALQEIGRHLKNHKKKSAQKAKTKEKFELVNEILPAIATKASTLLGRSEPDLGPIITKIMNAIRDNAPPSSCPCEATGLWANSYRIGTSPLNTATIEKIIPLLVLRANHIDNADRDIIDMPSS